MEYTSKIKSDPIIKLINFVATTIFICMMLAALAQIIFRFILKISVPWTEELARVFYVYTTFLGLILLEVDNNSIKVTFLVDKLPFKLRLLLQVFLNLFGIFFLVRLFIGAVIMFKNSNTMNFGTMPFLKVSLMYIPILVACPLTSFYLIKQLFNFQIKEEINTEEFSGAEQGKDGIKKDGSK